MDFINLIDILFVAIPEALVIITFGLLISYSNYFENKSIKMTIKKFLISVTFMILGVIYSRSNFTNILYIGLFSMSLYVIVYKFWGLNWRLTLFNSSLVMFLIFALENLYKPFLIYLGSMSNLFTQSRIIASLPMRLLEILIIYLICIKKLNIGKFILFRYDWKNLDLKSKITVIVLIVFMFLNVIIAGLYTDITIKQAINYIKVYGFQIDLDVAFYSVLGFAIFALILIWQTKNYYENEDIKRIFSIPKKKLFKNFLRASSLEDLIDYKEMLDEYIKMGGEKNEVGFKLHIKE